MAEPNDSFVRGICVGIASSAVAIHVWLAFQLAVLRGMYADLAAAPPALTRLVTSPVWLWSVPVVGALTIGALIARRPQRTLLYAAVALTLVLLAIATWHWSQAPLHELAAPIR